MRFASLPNPVSLLIDNEGEAKRQYPPPPAAVKPYGEITKYSVMERFENSIANLDPIAGIWSIKAGPEIAILDNDTNISPEYNYVGVVIDPRGTGWTVGEAKFWLKTMADGSYYAEYLSTDAFAKHTLVFDLEDPNILMLRLGASNKIFLRSFPTDVQLNGSVAGKGGSSKKITSGTGFFVGPSLIVTNWHVVDVASAIQLDCGHGLKLPATLVIKDSTNDLAILRGACPDRETYLNVRAEDSVAEGRHVYTIGFPMPGTLGDRPKIGEGIVNSLAGITDDPTMFQVDIPIQPGNSGGPLLDSSGLVIGVITSTLNNKYVMARTGTLPQNVNFAVKYTILNNLLNMLDMPATMGNAALLDKADSELIMRTCKAAVVKIEASQ